MGKRALGDGPLDWANQGKSFDEVRCPLCGDHGLHICRVRIAMDHLAKMKQDMWEKAVLAGRTVEEADAIVKAYEERFTPREISQAEILRAFDRKQDG